jgi:hypothetical protein
MVSDLDQRRRTVRVLELLSESVEAYARGDSAGADRLIEEAAEVDVMAMSGIQGGILIGEIPHPEQDWAAWTEYVQAARDALAEAEAREGGNDAS